MLEQANCPFCGRPCVKDDDGVRKIAHEQPVCKGFTLLALIHALVKANALSAHFDA